MTFLPQRKKPAPEAAGPYGQPVPRTQFKPFELGNHRAAWLCWQRDMIGMAAWLLKAVMGIVVLLLPD
ncbi:hypothetical protein RFM23_12915 [Mesorhizobium abyssinicae]|uniref:Uncharacterized protein n=1 Tax=Mesorhizobium abyssinicae TaxID=1209958 RepID=A0ABU5AMP2_9HYPH|nr:hypothetical protein [Mesorhizobium abyssinicae]MDX8538521.1 hypothetical protein [Mesorhizobium abyssinicae]